MGTTEALDTIRPPDASDDCYRCGYALRGIADEQPCPECGLIALRSRRPSDELHDTRPPWLRRLALGTALILLAILSVPIWPFALEVYHDRVFAGGWSPAAFRFRETGWVIAGEASALILLGGVILLTSREGYEPADRADRGLRFALRWAAAAPLAALAVVHADAEISLMSGTWRYGLSDWSAPKILAITLATVGCVPLPLLMFSHLGGLAGRARSAHLAEHCKIVGLGTSATLLFVPVVMLLFENAERLGLGSNWVNRSTAALVLVLILSVAATLFPLWSSYLLVRFALAFRGAARKLKRQWHSNDRALAIRA